MARDNFVSVSDFARRFGLRRSVVKDRIKRGDVKADRTASGLRIPASEVERVDAEIRAESEARRVQLETVQSFAREIDGALHRASAVIHKAASAITTYAVGTKKWDDTLDALRLGIEAYDRAFEAQVPYLAVARRVEREGLDWLRQFDGADAEPDEQEAPAGGR